MTDDRVDAISPDEGLKEAILESISDGVFTVDLEWRIRYFNRAAERITGIDRSETLGRHCSEVFRSSICETDCALRGTLETGQPIVNRTCFIVDSEGESIPVSISTAVLRDRSGSIIGGAETFRDMSEVETLRRELHGKWSIGDIISRSSAMTEVLGLIPAIAESPGTLLISGETGTGKELVARAVHNYGPRADRPFVAVNCASISEGLIESELFGHARGAFTGAVKDRQGRFAAAEDGTFFLDEIGELSISLQVKLLRVLQERTFEPVGSNESVAFKARLIAATNRDLAGMVRDGLFRRDLYYRIDVLRLELPPLRERHEDISILAWHFVRKYNALEGKKIAGISTEAMEALLAHDWPGNIRELENTIERATVMCRGDVIYLENLPDFLMEDRPSTDLARANTLTLSESLKSVHRQKIFAALEGNFLKGSLAARELGVHKTTLYRWMKELGITPPLRKKRTQRRNR